MRKTKEDCIKLKELSKQIKALLFANRHNKQALKLLKEEKRAIMEKYKVVKNDRPIQTI